MKSRYSQREVRLPWELRHSIWQDLKFWRWFERDVSAYYERLHYLKLSEEELSIAGTHYRIPVEKEEIIIAKLQEDIEETNDLRNEFHRLKVKIEDASWILQHAGETVYYKGTAIAKEDTLTKKAAEAQRTKEKLEKEIKPPAIKFKERSDSLISLANKILKMIPESVLGRELLGAFVSENAEAVEFLR